MQLPSAGFLISAFFQAFRRFPGAMICAFAGTAIALALIDAHGNAEDYGRALMSFAWGLPLMTALVAFGESRHWEERIIWALQAGAFVLLALSWWYFDPHAADFEQQRVFQFFSLVLIVHLAVAFAPYLNHRSVRDFWEYNRLIFAQFIVGAAFSLILFAGLSLALLAVDNLFNLHLSDRIYGRLFIVLAGVFNTTYFLFQFPQSFALSDPEGQAYNWVFRTLCKYILIPIVLLYFLILYAYGAKIGLEWSLPKGWVGSLVLGFSVAGIFSYLLNFYLDEEDNSMIVKAFKRYFWWVLLPLTGLLFIAIGKRIGDYGVTEERYLVLLLGIWLALACCYFLVSKHDNIKYIPISLAIGTLVWAFGPLSAFAVSKRSQQHIVQAILSQNGYWENGKIKKGGGKLTEPEYEQLSSAVDYLEHRKALDEFYPQPIDSAVMNDGGLLKWLQIEAEKEKQTSRTAGLNSNSISQMNVKGFDSAIHIDLYGDEQTGATDSGRYYRLSSNGQMLECWEKKDGPAKIVAFYSLKPVLAKWRNHPDILKGESYFTLPESERIIPLNGNKAKLSLYTESASFEAIDTEKGVSALTGWLLIKEK